MSETNFINESEVSYMPTAFKYGLIGTLISVGIGLAMYLGDMFDPANSSMANIISGLIYIGAIVMAIKTYRDTELNGFVGFGRAFMTGFMTSVVMAILGAIWTYVFMGFIAPEMMDVIQEAQMQAMVEQGLDEDQIEQSMEMMSSFMSPGFIAVSAIFIGLFMGAIISLITAAIMKKDHPATV